MIEIGSKYVHKDGGVYEVVDNQAVTNATIGIYPTCIKGIAYKDQQGEIYIRTEKHFLSSFKPYEPVYEYQWAIPLDDNNCSFLARTKFLTDNEFFTSKLGLSAKNYQRLDFTKRERK
jgi:hypothetical protein